MSEVPQRFDHVRRWALLARILGLVGVAAAAVLGIYLLIGAVGEGTLLPISVGVGVLAASVALAAVLIFMWNLVVLFLKIEANTFRSYDALHGLETSMDEQLQFLKVIADATQLSDTARAITHREKERTALRLAINDEIIRGDWEAAYALVEVLESRHGYKNEAARLRAELDRSREQDRIEKVQEAVERVRSLMTAHDWNRARREMDELLARNPDNEAVQALPALFAKRRDEHKRHLLKQWDEAVRRSEVDRGIAILKELDQYLTPREAAALQESVRGVFQLKLHNLGVQFSLTVTDRNWEEAIAVGQQIIQEFPNSGMAQEVKERMHVLRKRAEEESAAPAHARQD